MALGKHKGHSRQRAAVEEEAQAAGVTVSQVHEVVLDHGSGLGKRLGGALVATFGGSLNHDSFHVYELQGSAGEHRFIQPYSSNMVLPGEHRAVVQGSVPASFKVVQTWLGDPANLRLVLVLGMFTCGGFWLLIALAGWRRPKIICDDPALQTQLRNHPDLRSALSGLKFQWGIGGSVINLDWAVQVRPLEDGTSEVVMATGRYGGFTTYKVGMKQFEKLVTALPGVLQASDSTEEQPFLEPLRFPNGLPVGEPTSPDAAR